jgi:tetratricopeptide (TPR) repeat protein
VKVWWLILCGLTSVAIAAEKPVTAPELLQQGWTHYQLAEFSLAVKTFEQAEAAAGSDSEARVEALYGLASTWNLRRPDQDEPKAVEFYRQIIDAAPKSDWAAWSGLALARMKHTAAAGQPIPDFEEARRAYQDVIDRFPFHPAGEEALLFQQATRLVTPVPEETHRTLAVLEKFVQTHPESHYRMGAYKMIAFCCEMLGEKPKLLAASIQALKCAEIDQRSPTTDLPQVYYRIAVIAEFDCGEFATAREYFHKLIEEYPTDQRVFISKQELRHMDEMEAKLRQEAAPAR